LVGKLILRPSKETNTAEPHQSNVCTVFTSILLYSLLTSPVQPDDEPVIRPKHVVVFVLI